MANLVGKKSKVPTTTFVKKNKKKAELKATLSADEEEYSVKLDFMRMYPPNKGSAMAFNKKPMLRIRRFKTPKTDHPRFEFEYKEEWYPFDSTSQEALDDMYNPVERHEANIQSKERRRNMMLAFGFAMVFVVGAYVIVEIGIEPQVIAGAMSILTVMLLLGREYWEDYAKGKFPIEDHTITKVGDDRQKDFEEVMLFYIMEALVARIGVSDSNLFALGGELVFRQNADWQRLGWSKDISAELFARFTFDGTCVDAIQNLQEILEEQTQSDGVTFSHIVTGYTSVDQHELDTNVLTITAKANDQNWEVPVIIRYGFPMTPAPVVAKYKPLLCPPVDINAISPEMMAALKLARLGDVHTPKKEAKQLADDLKKIFFQKTYKKKRLMLALRVLMALHNLQMKDVQPFLKKNYLMIHDKVF